MLDSQIQAPEGPPNIVTASACLIKWPRHKDVNHIEAAKPQDRRCIGDPVTVELRPYGSTPLHMTDLPTMTFGKMFRPIRQIGSLGLDAVNICKGATSKTVLPGRLSVDPNSNLHHDIYKYFLSWPQLV